MVSGRTFRTPLRPYRVRGIDSPLVRAVLKVWVRTGPRHFQEVEFRVDSGAGITAMSVAKAGTLGLSLPRKTIEFRLETALGKVRQTRHPGRIQVRIPELGNRVFDWPCHFVETRKAELKDALGLTGVVSDLRITLDGTYAFEAPYGWLVIEDLHQE